MTTAHVPVEPGAVVMGDVSTGIEHPALDPSTQKEGATP